MAATIETEETLAEAGQGILAEVGQESLADAEQETLAEAELKLVSSLPEIHNKLKHRKLLIKRGNNAKVCVTSSIKEKTFQILTKCMILCGFAVLRVVLSLAKD